MKHIAMSIVTAAVLAASLSACVPLVVGGAVVGGGLVATDRRTSGIQLEDQGIELRASNALSNNLSGGQHINVHSYNRQVLLTGEVPTEQDKQRATEAVSRVENVHNVVNELAVMGNSTLTQRSSDVLVSNRVRASLVAASDLNANAFAVTVERGVVYLMGRVTANEAQRATEIARGVSGVQKIVQLFEIIPESELQYMLPRPQTSASSPTAPAR